MRRVSAIAEERILVQGPLSEDRTLKVLARDAIADGRSEALDLLRAELAKTARALAALHHSAATYGSTATFAGELAEVQDVIDRLAITLPELAGAADPLLSRLTGLAEQFPAEDVVPAHHDFRPAQVLLSGGGVGFITSTVRQWLSRHSTSTASGPSYATSASPFWPQQVRPTSRTLPNTWR